MLIPITGVPGTGKTSSARLLARLLRLPYSNPGEAAIKAGKGKALENFVELDPSEILDFLPKTGVVESHLLCELPWEKIVVLRCAPEVLAQRLEKKSWPSWKIQENVEAEIIDYCGSMVRENQGLPLYVDTTERTPEESAEAILRAWEEGNSEKTWEAEAETHLQKWFQSKPLP